MTVELKNLNYTLYPQEISSYSKILHQIPIEGIAYLVASIALRLFSVSLSSPILGIGLSIIATSLAIKAMEWYDNRLVVDLTKEACKFNRSYPNLQMVLFVTALAISFFSETLSFVTGIYLGSFGTIIMDVENYKRLQEESRKKQSALRDCF